MAARESSGPPGVISASPATSLCHHGGLFFPWHHPSSPSSFLKLQSIYIYKFYHFNPFTCTVGGITCNHIFMQLSITISSSSQIETLYSLNNNSPSRPLSDPWHSLFTSCLNKFDVSKQTWRHTAFVQTHWSSCCSLNTC